MKTAYLKFWQEKTSVLGMSENRDVGETPGAGFPTPHTLVFVVVALKACNLRASSPGIAFTIISV
jgi:hypothetical protein